MKIDATLVIIPLRDAYLCCDCESISNDATRCWACGNTLGLVPLARVLDAPTHEHGARRSAVSAAFVSNVVGCLDCAKIAAKMNLDEVDKKERANDPI